MRVEPVYTLDADLVVVLDKVPHLSQFLAENGFSIQTFEHALNAHAPGSKLRIQFTTDPRCQEFLLRAQRQMVLGTEVLVACLEDVTKDKLWAYGDPTRRLSKRKKDELDLIRLAESFPELKRTYPPELAGMLDGI
jgi:hypothetical protein